MVRCPECQSQYFSTVERRDDEGRVLRNTDAQPDVLQCANCRHMFFVEDGQTHKFEEMRPMAMTEPDTGEPVEQGGPIGRKPPKSA